MGLTSQEMDAEPIDEFFTNRYIYAEIQKKQRMIDKHGE